MNGAVFEDWVENSLLKNLQQDKKVLTVMETLSISVNFLKTQQH